MPKKAKGKGAEGGGSKKSGGKGQWRWLWLTFFVVVADLTTKSMASYYLSSFYSKDFMPGVTFALAHNRGAAFSFLADADGWQLWFFVGIALAVCIGILSWLWRSSSLHPLTAASLSLILGGAIGNTFDRTVYGYVVDFIDVHVGTWHWPTFNLADSAITLGVILMILSAFRKG